MYIQILIVCKDSNMLHSRNETWRLFKWIIIALLLGNINTYSCRITQQYRHGTKQKLILLLWQKSKWQIQFCFSFDLGHFLPFEATRQYLSLSDFFKGKNKHYQRDNIQKAINFQMEWQKFANGFLLPFRICHNRKNRFTKVEKWSQALI